MPLLKQLKVIAPLVISRALEKESPQRKRVNSFLAKQMGENKGLWLKVGQMLSLHPESWEGLEDIPQSENLPSLGPQEMGPYLEGLFEVEGRGKELLEKLIYPGYPASLSQVHHLRPDPDQEKWVLKVKLPGIKEVIEDQLELFGFLGKASALRGEKKTFSSNAYQKTIGESFERELDYEQERLNIKLMSPLEERFPTTCEVPKLHPKIQGQDFITMSLLEGDSWQCVLEQYTEEEKQEVANELFKQALYQYFCRGHCQGDFHPGNFFFKRSPEGAKIGWIDLGQCLKPTTKERKALMMAIEGLTNGENLALGPLFAAWNFNLEKLSPIAERLPLLLTKIFQPLLYPNTFSLKSWQLKKDIDHILGEDRWWFRTAGSPELFLSIRAWIGLFSMIEALDVSVFFKGIWRELLPEIKDAIPNVSLPDLSLKNISFNDLAKFMTVQIFEDENEKVSLQLPARAIEDIEEFISVSTLTEMKRVGIDLDKVVSDQLKKGLRPDVIVDYKENNKRYLVTLT